MSVLEAVRGPQPAELVAAREVGPLGRLGGWTVDHVRTVALAWLVAAVALGASQQNVSKHLAVLAEAGILGRRKTGTHVYYRVVDEGVFALCEQVCGSLQQQLRALNELVEGVSS